MAAGFSPPEPAPSASFLTSGLSVVMGFSLKAASRSAHIGPHRPLGTIARWFPLIRLSSETPGRRDLVSDVKPALSSFMSPVSTVEIASLFCISTSATIASDCSPCPRRGFKTTPTTWRFHVAGSSKTVSSGCSMVTGLPAKLSMVAGLKSSSAVLKTVTQPEASGLSCGNSCAAYRRPPRVAMEQSFTSR